MLRGIDCSRLNCVVLIVLLSTSVSVEARRGPDLPVEFLGGTVTIESIETGYNPSDINQPTRVRSTNGASVMLDFGVNALGFAGELRANWIADSPESDFKFRYGDRIFQSGSDRAEVYSFSASNLGDDFDVHLFHHIPRYHWGYEGDFFGLMYETTNMYDQDIWNDRAPSGVEIVGKKALEGLKVVGGKEVYWGAHPMVIAKYQFGSQGQYSVMLESDTTDQDERKRASLQGAFDLTDSTQLLAGLLRSNREVLGEVYAYEESGVIKQRAITHDDTMAFLLRLEQEVGSSSMIYGDFYRAGAVAERGEFQERWDTNIPYSQKGNQSTVELGARLSEGSWMLSPRIFRRTNEYQAYSLDARQRGFFRTGEHAVYDNRPANAAEIFLTFDPTPGTEFYEWDNYLKEDAPFAFNVGITRVNYTGRTDARDWDWGAPALSQDWGRDPEKTERIFSRFVYNPTASIKLSGEFETGHQVPLFGGDRDNVFAPTRILDNKSRFTSLDMTLVYDRKNIFNFVYKNDAYGEYDWFAEYGVSFPRQITLGYERLLDDRSSPSRVGIELHKRDLNADSGAFWAAGENRNMQEARLYYVYSF